MSAGGGRRRVVLCLTGAPERARGLRTAINAHPSLAVVAAPRSLAELQQRLADEPADVAVVAGHLTGLDDWLRAGRAGDLPLLVLADTPAGPWLGRPGVAVAPADTPSPRLVEAILALAEGRLPATAAPPAQAVPAVAGALPDPAAARGRLLAVAGVGGSGASRATIETGLALAEAGPTLLIDLNLRHPGLHALLNQPLQRNIAAVAGAAGADAPADRWAAALDRVVAPIGPARAGLAVLGGLPHRQLAVRRLVGAAFVDRLLDEALARYRHVVVDLGAVDLTERDLVAQAHRTVLVRADRIVLTVAPRYEQGARLHDLLGSLIRAEEAVDTLGLPPDRLELLVCGLGGGSVIARDELAEAFGGLGCPLTVIPFDRAGVEEAQRQQRPLLLTDARSPAARAYRQYGRVLAERLGTAAPAGRRRWWPWPAGRDRAAPAALPGALVQRVVDEGG
ncbi:MAG: hypothetical protein IT340_22150 [Chloroflexi bacterium]|nr:hypothetical protein [Chloroflexota bacterium]